MLFTSFRFVYGSESLGVCIQIVFISVFFFQIFNYFIVPCLKVFTSSTFAWRLECTILMVTHCQGFIKDDYLKATFKNTF